MSLANAKTEKGTPSTAAAGATSAVAVVQPTPAAQDPNHGRGGRYQVIDGQRHRVEASKPQGIKE